MAPIDPKVADKVRKLMRLGESPNEHEAAGAAAEAARLMALHGIELAQLAEVDEPSPIVEETVDKWAKACHWKFWLAQGAIRSQGGEAWYLRRRMYDDRHRVTSFTCAQLAGTQAQIDGARYIYQAMVGEVQRLADAAYREEVRECIASGVERPSVRTWKNSFRLGAAVTISQRLEAQYKATKAEVASSNEQALVHVSRQDDALATYVEAQNLGRGRRTQVGSYSGYSAGRAAGEGVALSGGRGLGAPAKRLRG